MNFHEMYEKARALNFQNIYDFLQADSSAKILDLGCDDGNLTLILGEKLKSKKLYGIEIVDSRIEESIKKGIKVTKCDLNGIFDFPDNSFDVIHSNQVIEHISNLDNFMSELYRILKPNGYTIISTENGSSWHNIFASIMGWQIFSLTNFSEKKTGLGNPLAIHRDSNVLNSWTHKTIFNYLGFKELFEIYGFKNIQIKGSGYYPFPASFGKYDVKHSHFITLKGYK